LTRDPEDHFKGTAGDGLTDSAIDGLIEERNAARANKDFARADEIREQLVTDGIELEDLREGTRWRRA
jgi:cysteinyl-tRNA synthetase